MELKREAMKQGEPISEVERQIKRFNETLRIMGYAGKSRSKAIASVYSFIQSKGYVIPKRLIRMNMADKFTMRVPEREEIEFFLQYAKGLERKLLYTLMTETPCRPRVFPALRWNWLEPDWWRKDVVHISLPKEFRPSNTGGPKKFEPICFIGPRGIKLLKQLREAKIKSGKIPMDTDRILSLTYPGMTIAIRRDYETLVKLGLIRSSRTDEEGKLTEQAISAKSWRKYHFNIIDAIPDISPEWRSMLKGRDLKMERYYSKENIEQLRDVYGTKIYPKLWSDLEPKSANILSALKQAIRNDSQAWKEFVKFANIVTVEEDLRDTS